MDDLIIGKSDRLLVKRAGALGDFVLTLPAIAALRRAFPGAHLQLIGDPRFHPLARPDQALDHDAPGLVPLYSGSQLKPEFSACFSGCAFSLVYAVDPDGQLERSLRRLVAGELRVWDPRPPEGRHITDHLLEPLRQLGLPIADPLPRFGLEPAERAYAQGYWGERRLKSPLVLIHPGSGGRRKCWPLGHFLELARLCGQEGLEVLLLHGPAETDLAAQILAHPFGRGLACSPPGLLELAGLLESAALFVGNDSGPGHLAAALGTPTLVLFGPTDPGIWRPPHPWARVLRAPEGRLADLEVETVAATLGELLNSGPTARP